MPARKMCRTALWHRCCPPPRFLIFETGGFACRAPRSRLIGFWGAMMEEVSIDGGHMTPRSRARKGATVAAIAGAMVMLASVAMAQGKAAGDVSGVWWGVKYSPKLEIQGGGDIPYNDKGKAQYAKNMAGLKDGSIKDESRRLCNPDGVPRILGNPYPFKIIHTTGQTTIVYEL